MRLSTRSRYGTRMLLDIALHSKEEPVRIKDVAERQFVSIKYLEKIIKVLKDEGYIKSKRGPDGGHTLAVLPSSIKIGEVVKALEGDTALTKCVEADKICTKDTKCIMFGVWQEATKAMFDKLNSISLADLMQSVAEQKKYKSEQCNQEVDEL